MTLLHCPKCGHLTRVDGEQHHYPGCELEPKKETNVFPDEEIDKLAAALCALECKRFPEHAIEWVDAEPETKEAYKNNVLDVMAAFESVGYVFITSKWLDTLYSAYETKTAR